MDWDCNRPDGPTPIHTISDWGEMMSAEKEAERLLKEEGRLLREANRAYGDGGDPDIAEIERLMDERESATHRRWTLRKFTERLGR